MKYIIHHQFEAKKRKHADRLFAKTSQIDTRQATTLLLTLQEADPDGPEVSPEPTQRGRVDHATYEQIKDTFREMGTPEENLPGRIRMWVDDEETMAYRIGCPDWLDRPALIHILEAGYHLNGGDRQAAKSLLRKAIKLMEGK